MMRKTFFIMLMVSLVSAPAMAFQIGSAFTNPCHESITLKGFFADDNLQGENTLIPNGAFENNEVPDDAIWLEVAKYLEAQIDYQFKTDFERFLAITLFIGVRYPDLAHFSLTDINSMRSLHMAEEGQEAHALRSDVDDHAQGNELAVLATRAYIIEQIDLAYEAFQNSRTSANAPITVDSLKAQSAKVRFYLEYYGTIRVDVWTPLFLVGKAVHALQDSFSHSYRSEDTLTIYAVGNYLEAMSSDYVEQRDGPRHSNHQDDCELEAVMPLVDSSVLATREIFSAAREYFIVPKDNAEGIAQARANIEIVLDKWMHYQPGCDYSTNYCDTPWAPLAKSSETFPILSCSSQIGSNTSGYSGAWITGLMLTLWMMRRRRLSTQR